MSLILNPQNFQNLPACAAVPSSPVQLVNKAYTDGTFGKLASINSWSAVNTFTVNPVFPTDAASGYVATCTDSSGAWGWAPAAGGGSTTVTVSTTDATPTALISVPMTAGSIIHLRAILVGANADYSIGMGGFVDVTARYGATGPLVIMSSPYVGVDSGFAPTSPATFNAVISGTDLVIQVVGDPSVAVNWKATYVTVLN